MVVATGNGQLRGVMCVCVCVCVDGAVLDGAVLAVCWLLHVHCTCAHVCMYESALGYCVSNGNVIV